MLAVFRRIGFLYNISNNSNTNKPLNTATTHLLARLSFH